MVSSLIESCQKHSIIPVPPKKKMTLIRIVTRFSSSYAMVRTLKSVFSAIFPAQCGAPPPRPGPGRQKLDILVGRVPGKVINEPSRSLSVFSGGIFFES